MRHEIYFWREEGPIAPAADSVLDRLAEDRNLPGVSRLSIAAVKDVFTRHFPNISITADGMGAEAGDCPFRVSFCLDDSSRPMLIRIDSPRPLDQFPEIFDLLFAATRELGCTKIEAAFR